MSHGGMGGHGGQGGHGGSGHHSGQGQHGAYGHQASQHAPSHHIPNPHGENHHGSYADSAFVHHGAPGGHARGSGSMGRGVSGAAHSIGGAYGQIAGTFLNAVAHAFGLGSHGPGGHNGHAPAGASPGTHHVNDFPNAAMADRKPQASPIASQSQRALDNAQTFKRKKLIEFGFYSLAMVVILGLYLCVVSATRQAELQRKAEAGVFPSARYGAQMAQFEQPQASNQNQPAFESRSTFSNQPSYAGQSIGINAASSADYTSAFGSARSGTEEDKPSESLPQAVGSELNRPLSESLTQPQPAFQQRLQNVSEAGVYQVNNQVNNVLTRTSGFPYKQRFELPGELARSQPDRFATGAPSGNISGGFPVSPYAQSDGLGPYSQAPQYPGYAQQSAWPPRGSDPGLDGGLNPRRLAPRIVVVGR